MVLGKTQKMWLTEKTLYEDRSRLQNKGSSCIEMNNKKGICFVRPALNTLRKGPSVNEVFSEFIFCPFSWKNCYQPDWEENRYSLVL